MQIAWTPWIATITCRLMSTAFSGQLVQVAEPTELATVLLRHAVHASPDAAPTAADAKPARQGVHVVEFDWELYVPANQSSSTSLNKKSLMIEIQIVAHLWQWRSLGTVKALFCNR